MADEEISYQSATRDVLLSAAKVIGEGKDGSYVGLQDFFFVFFFLPLSFQHVHT